MAIESFIERMRANACLAAFDGTDCMAMPTAVPRLRLWRSIEPGDPVPALFEPRFYLLLQGAKRMAIAGRIEDFRSGMWAVSTVGLPFHVQVTDASPEMPYLGIGLDLDAAVLADMLLTVPDGEPDAPSAFAVGEVAADVAETMDRMLRLLATPDDVPALAPLFERELVYRLLRGPAGGTLRQALHRHSRFAQVRTAADWIRAHANEAMSVERLAVSVGMSPTSFHRHFKSVTAYSPLAYQRHIRLLSARGMLASRAVGVTTAAFECGYSSASQFSREYKRMFGVAPTWDVRPSVGIRHRPGIGDDIARMDDSRSQPSL